MKHFLKGLNHGRMSSRIFSISDSLQLLSGAADMARQHNIGL